MWNPKDTQGERNGTCNLHSSKHCTAQGSFNKGEWRRRKAEVKRRPGDHAGRVPWAVWPQQQCQPRDNTKCHLHPKATGVPGMSEQLGVAGWCWEHISSQPEPSRSEQTGLSVGRDGIPSWEPSHRATSHSQALSSPWNLLRGLAADTSPSPRSHRKDTTSKKRLLVGTERLGLFAKI